MKNKKKNVLFIIIVIILILSFIFSIYKIIKWNIDNNKTNKIINNIKNEVLETKDNDNIEIIEQKDNIDKSDPYFDYIKMNMIDVNFDNLKKINNDIKGWIRVNGTNVNYPFVQGSDNDFYLNHSLDKKSNGGGWLFLDYRNDLLNNKNTIIYGHGRINKSMFGSLKNILGNGWLDNKDNFVIKLSTENELTLWQIFSVYKIPTTSDYLQINFDSDNEYETFINKLISRSEYNFNTSVSTSDNILTLSTCYNNSDKLVVHAKLIKRETK